MIGMRPMLSGDAWETVRFALESWARTIRLVVLLAALAGFVVLPMFLISQQTVLVFWE